MPTTDLAARECVPCKGGVPPLDEAERAKLLEMLGPNGWEVVNGHHLRKEYEFPNFVTALAFVNKVGAVAESLREAYPGHHVVTDLASILRHSLDRRIEIRVELDDGAATVRGDPDQIHNALQRSTTG